MADEFRWLFLPSHDPDSALSLWCAEPFPAEIDASQPAGPLQLGMQFSQTASASPGAPTHRHRLIFAQARSTGWSLFAIFTGALAIKKTISFLDYRLQQAQLLS